MTKDHSDIRRLFGREKKNKKQRKEENKKRRKKERKGGRDERNIESIEK